MRIHDLRSQIAIVP